MLLLSDVLASVPVLHGDGGLRWADAGLASLHVAEDLDGVQRRALVRVHPVRSLQEKQILVNFRASKCTIISIWICESMFTALPFRMAHPQVTAHAGRVGLGSFGATDVLNLLAQRFQGGVHLSIAVTNASIISSVASTQWIWTLLALWHGKEGLTDASRSRRTRRSRSTRSTLVKRENITWVHPIGCYLDLLKSTLKQRPQKKLKRDNLAVKLCWFQTYSGSHFSRATTGSRGSNGSRNTIHAILTRRSIGTRRSLLSRWNHSEYYNVCMQKLVLWFLISEQNTPNYHPVNCYCCMEKSSMDILPRVAKFAVFPQNRATFKLFGLGYGNPDSAKHLI